MIVYHIDRASSLRAGMTFSCNQYGLTRHGEKYWKAISATDISAVNDALIEHIFEEIRLQFYPDRPSRFASVFACADLNQLNLWGSHLKIPQDCPVWEIETPTLFLADSALLRCLAGIHGQQVFDFSLARAFAHEYWQGATVAHPTASLPDSCKPLLDTLHSLPEALIPPTARVIRRF